MAKPKPIDPIKQAIDHVREFYNVGRLANEELGRYASKGKLAAAVAKLNAGTSSFQWSKDLFSRARTLAQRCDTDHLHTIFSQARDGGLRLSRRKLLCIFDLQPRQRDIILKAYLKSVTTKGPDGLSLSELRSLIRQKGFGRYEGFGRGVKKPKTADEAADRLPQLVKTFRAYIDASRPLLPQYKNDLAGASRAAAKLADSLKKLNPKPEPKPKAIPPLELPPYDPENPFK